MFPFALFYARRLFAGTCCGIAVACVYQIVMLCNACLDIERSSTLAQLILRPPALKHVYLGSLVPPS